MSYTSADEQPPRLVQQGVRSRAFDRSVYAEKGAPPPALSRGYRAARDG